MKHTKKLKPLILVVGALLLSACATPLAIKNLSSEQLNAQQEFKEALTALFKRVEIVILNQVQAVEQEIISTDKNRLKQGAELVKSGGQTPQQFTDTYIKETKVRAALLVRAKENLARLKSAHANLLNAYDDMVRAQKTLDDYLRLEKADEIVANSLLASVGIRRKQVEQALDVATKALNASMELNEIP